MSLNLDQIVLKEVPTPEHIAGLKAKRWWTHRHTFVNDILTKLVTGTQLVAHPSDTEEVEAFVKCPEKVKVQVVKDHELKLVKMDDCHCHDNSLKLLCRGKVVEMRSGYALSDDGLWRHHSWGVEEDGSLVETTMKRLVYVSSNCIRSL